MASTHSPPFDFRQLVFAGGGIRGVQPSEEVAADKIDFSERPKVDDIWAQGERDARRWLESRGLAG